MNQYRVTFFKHLLSSERTVWQAIPADKVLLSDRNLHLAVIDARGVHSLIFPCRLLGQAWVSAKTGKVVDIHPTHWRAWQEGNSMID